MGQQRKPLFQSSTQSAEELRDEADRILGMLEGHEDAMSRTDRVVLEWADGRDVTPRMIFWLRDIKERYCD